MNRPSVYQDLDGHAICLEHLDAEERRLLARLRRRARSNPDWDAFDNYWTRAVPALYAARGLTRKAVARTVLWRIARDLSARLGIAAGLVRAGDYRDDLEDLIRTKFGTQRAFCQATGIAEDLLSHVLAGRKDLSLATLNGGLERIGYTLHIQPIPKNEQAPRTHAAPTPTKKRTG